MNLHAHLFLCLIFILIKREKKRSKVKHCHTTEFDTRNSNFWLPRNLSCVKEGFGSSTQSWLAKSWRTCLAALSLSHCFYSSRLLYYLCYIVMSSISFKPTRLFSNFSSIEDIFFHHRIFLCSFHHTQHQIQHKKCDYNPENQSF